MFTLQLLCTQAAHAYPLASPPPPHAALRRHFHADALKKCSLKKRPDCLTVRGRAGSSKSTATMPKRSVYPWWLVFCVQLLVRRR